jgi:hypothetical protein
MKKLVLVAAAALALTGCAVQRFDLQPATQDAAAYNDSQSFWIGGIGQSEEIDAAKVCGGAKKVQRVETQVTAGNIGLTVVTLGIYSPRQIRVFCVR